MTRPPSGIYKITNNKNGRVYIGQSQNMYIRWKQHRAALKAGKHPNKLLQNDWKVSSKSFRWDVVEYCGIDELNEREKYWIERYNSIKEGYNQGWVPFKRKNKNKKTKPRRYGK